MPVTGMMKEIIESRNKGIDLLLSIARSLESGTISMHTEMYIKKCRKYLDDNTKTTI